MKRFLSLALATIMSVGITSTAFAGVDDAYFFGDDPYLTEMEDVESNISRLGYYTKIYANPSESRFTASRLNSSFLYFAGHGTTQRLDTGDSGICIDNRSGFKDVSNSSFSRAELAILAACKTGYFNADPTDCLAGVIEDNGANCVLAWSSTPNTDTLADYTRRYSYYVRRGENYMDAAISTREYLINHGVFETASVFDTVLFGRYNDTLPEVVDAATALYSSTDPVAPYLDEDLNQHIITENVKYVAESDDYDEISNYIKENFDEQFDIDDYTITEYGAAENGVNSIVFRLKIDGLSSNYGFSVICIDDEAKLINFTNTYDSYKVDDIKAMPVELCEYDDSELLEMAINKDGFDYDVEEQYVQKHFDVEKGITVCEVNTVYTDENGNYFCTVNVF